jgi:predicted enzyme related to lactoylglutathione lyase
MADPNKPHLKATAPVLLVKDVVVAANHYRDAMGFTYEKFWGEPAAFVMLQRDGLTVMLRQAKDPKHIVPNWTVVDKLWDIYFWVSDADALHAEFVTRGAKIDYGLCDQPYGCREFGTQDIDGHDIGFGQVIAP